MEMNEYLLARMRAQPEKYHILVENPEFVNLSFWYVPKRLRDMPHSAEKEHLLGEVTPKIKKEMMMKGTLMIGYQPQGHIPNFFRNIISNPAIKKADVDYLLEELDKIGENM